MGAVPKRRVSVDLPTKCPCRSCGRVHFPGDDEFFPYSENVCPWCQDDAAAAQRVDQMVSLCVVLLQAHKPRLPGIVLKHIGNFLLPEFEQGACVRVYRMRVLELFLWGAPGTLTGFWTLEMHGRCEPIRILWPPDQVDPGPTIVRQITSVHIYVAIIFEFLYGKSGRSARSVPTFHGPYPYCYRQCLADVELQLLDLLDPVLL